MKRAILLCLVIVPAAGCAKPEARTDEAQAAAPGAGDAIELLPPRLSAGQPLMKALAQRRTQRAFSDRQLPLQVLSDLLWAAGGVNRPDEGKLTAPTAVNYQEIMIYVTMAQGTFLYERGSHSLSRVLVRDIRDDTGVPPSMRSAPVNLVFVSDTSRMTRMDDEDRAFYSATDTGFVSQNVYLFCASEGLATVVRGAIDREHIARTLGLGPGEKVILAQTVGYPAGI